MHTYERMAYDASDVADSQALVLAIVRLNCNLNVFQKRKIRPDANNQSNMLRSPARLHKPEV
jgi:hypothetical protein